MTSKQVAKGIDCLVRFLANSTDLPDDWEPKEGDDVRRAHWAYLKGFVSGELLRCRSELLNEGTGDYDAVIDTDIFQASVDGTDIRVAAVFDAGNLAALHQAFGRGPNMQTVIVETTLQALIKDAIEMESTVDGLQDAEPLRKALQAGLAVVERVAAKHTKKQGNAS